MLKLETKFNSFDQIKSLVAVTFNSEGQLVSKPFKISLDKAPIIKDDSVGKLLVDFSAFKDDVIFLYFFKEDGMEIKFCDKSNKDKPIFATWTTPQTYYETMLIVYSVRFLKYFLLFEKEEGRLRDFFNVIHQSLIVRISKQTSETDFDVDIISEGGYVDSRLYEGYKENIKLINTEWKGDLIGNVYEILILTYKPTIGEITRKKSTDQSETILYR
jgi:hypothetical protein